ncbi:hypothetical protein NQZ79_g7545 [Umbelopsis isabellina]|nr:hypothetical protein NQZ79_g7545 [Umbelopsis isabellina]
MFDQFKKISRFKDFTAAVGLNEQELRARGLDGLEAGRKVFQEFNSMITKHTSRSQTSSPQPRADDTSEATTPIDIPASKEWYEHLESAWQEILENNKANYALAEDTQLLLDSLMVRCTEQTEICQDFQKQCATLPEATKDLQSISETAEYEEDEFKAWKREQSAKLEQYKSAKRATYTQKEQQLQGKYDIHVKDLTSKRRELYEANFQAEIDDYRQRRENQVSSLYKGNIERPRIKSTTQRLDNLTLEADDSHVLDDFLGNDGISSENHPKATNKNAREDSDTDDEDAPHDLVQADEDYISS